MIKKKCKLCSQLAFDFHHDLQICRYPWKKSVYTSIFLTQNDKIKAYTLHNLHYFQVISMLRNRKQAALRGVEVMMTAVDLFETRTAGPSIYHNTSLQVHLQNQSHPLLTDVRIIELSLGFSCFSSSLFQSLVIVLYFTLTPFITKNILMCIYVNILPDCCQGHTEMLHRAW